MQLFAIKIQLKVVLKKGLLIELEKNKEINDSQKSTIIYLCFFFVCLFVFFLFCFFFWGGGAWGRACFGPVGRRTANQHF